MIATDLDSLLAAICADPKNDTLRLALADWLEENAGTMACRLCKGVYDEIRGVYGCKVCHGTGSVSDGRAELAEFVRVQVELAKRNPRDCNQGTCRTGGRDRPCTACREREELQSRERELWPAVRGVFGSQDWVASIFDPPSIHDLNMPTGWVVPLVIVSRGTPSVVRCTLAEWMGEECRHCEGTGELGYPKYGHRNCSACHGEGRTPGIGPRLAQAWPIVEVQVTDAVWRPGEGRLSELWLPRRNGEKPFINPKKLISQPDESAARAALSDALIEWARKHD